MKRDIVKWKDREGNAHCVTFRPGEIKNPDMLKKALEEKGWTEVSITSVE